MRQVVRGGRPERARAGAEGCREGEGRQEERTQLNTFLGVNDVFLEGTLIFTANKS